MLDWMKTRTKISATVLQRLDQIARANVKTAVKKRVNVSGENRYGSGEAISNSSLSIWTMRAQNSRKNMLQCENKLIT